MQGGRGPQFKSSRLSTALYGRSAGYTIVEVLVVLAVTGGLFVAIAATMVGRQAKTEFSTAAREMQSQIQDVINDVSTGYYSNPGSFQCTTSPISGGQQIPVISAPPPGGADQGSNDACIFVGRVSHFMLDGAAGGSYNTYTVAGARQVTSGTSLREVQDFDEANPQAITSPPFAPATVDITEPKDVVPGLEIAEMYYRDSSGRHNISAVGFFGSFGSYGTAGINSGSMGVDIVAIPSGTAKSNVVSAISGMGATGAAIIRNPSGGVFICLNGTGVNQNVLLSIGGNSQQLTTDIQIRNNKCADYPT